MNGWGLAARTLLKAGYLACSAMHSAYMTRTSGPRSGQHRLEHTMKSLMYSFVLLIPVIATSLTAGCAPKEDPLRENATYDLVSPATAYCTGGFAYSTSSRQCESATEMLGPFPPAMQESCRANGGQGACTADRWELAFARSIRGTSTCPPGTTFDTSLRVCTVGDAAYGPFTGAQYNVCRAEKGGSTCELNRWSKVLIKPAKSEPLAVPYINQYVSATVNPSGSCGNTSVSMVLRFNGLSASPDGIRAAYDGDGDCGDSKPWQCPEGLARIQRNEGLFAHFTRSGTRDLIKQQIDAGRPAIIHGFLTSVGHIITITGYDDAKKEWMVNDPAGIWCGGFGAGYDSCGGAGKTAAGIRYKYSALSDDIIGADGEIWISTSSRADFQL
jgi:hypothetical protein